MSGVDLVVDLLGCIMIAFIDLLTAILFIFSRVKRYHDVSRAFASID